MPTITKKIEKVVKKKETAKNTEQVALGLNFVNKDEAYNQVFNVAQNPDLTAQYLRVYQFNQREGNAHTKTRGEVSGSGKKPWKQKGTGRARVGSTRTPVWRHGGVSHGPLPKDWSLNLPKKMKSLAFLTAISDKVQNSTAYFVDKLDLAEGRTKNLIKIMDDWKLKGKLLIITAEKNQNLTKAAGNLQNVMVAVLNSLNAYQIIGSKFVVFEKEALDKLKERYAKDK